MTTFTDTTGYLSYSAELLPNSTVGEFSLGMNSTATYNLGFSAINQQQTGMVEDGESNSVKMFGDTVVFGSPQSNAALLYVNASGDDNPTLVLTNYLSGTGNILASKARFGQSIGLAANSVAIGAPDYFDTQTSGGKIFIFNRYNTFGVGVSGMNSWGLDLTLAGTLSSGDKFGESVDLMTAIPTDLLAVGAPNANNQHGKAYLFNVMGELQKELYPPLNQSGNYGNNVKLIRQEILFDEVAVAEYNQHNSGQVHIYQSTKGSTVTPNAWGRLQTIISPNYASGDFFGCALGGSLDYIIIGSPGEDNGKGRAYAYKYYEDYNLWKHWQTLQPSNLQNDNKFGKSLDFDGITLAIGSDFNSGAVHVYELGESTAQFSEASVVSGVSPIGSGAFGGNESGARGIGIYYDKIAVGTAGESSFYFYYTGSGARSSEYDCFSISGISGKIIDNDGNYVFGYNSGEKINISGNVFQGYHNYYINDTLINTNCSRYPGLGNTGSINSFTINNTGNFTDYVVRVNSL